MYSQKLLRILLVVRLSNIILIINKSRYSLCLNICLEIYRLRRNHLCAWFKGLSFFGELLAQFNGVKLVNGHFVGESAIYFASCKCGHIDNVMFVLHLGDVGDVFSS